MTLYHHTTGKASAAIRDRGFRSFNKSRNDYGAGVYFTSLERPKESLPFSKESSFSWDGKGLKLFAFTGIKDLLKTMLRYSSATKEMAADHQREIFSDHRDLLKNGVLAMGFDGIVSKNHPDYGTLVVVYNVKKLNKILFSKEIVREGIVNERVFDVQGDPGLGTILTRKGVEPKRRRNVKYLYHVSPAENLASIKQKGIVPMPSRWKKFKRSEKRVYLMGSEMNAKDMAYMFSVAKSAEKDDLMAALGVVDKHEYVVLKIDTTKLPVGFKIYFDEDTVSDTGSAFWTKQAVPRNAIVSVMKLRS